jgi:SHS2 domain-containing protein
VVGRGETLPEAFAQVALGVFALLADPASVEEREAREVRAHGSAPEALLVNWLNECLYVLDVEGFAARRVEFGSFALDAGAPGGEPLRLYCRLHGEDLDPARHIPSESVRAIVAAGAEVVSSGKGAEARVFFQGDGLPGALPK